MFCHLMISSIQCGGIPVTFRMIHCRRTVIWNKHRCNAADADEVVRAKKERRKPIILPDFSCHHLRHTFCTRLCEHETNLKVIQAIMGHKNIETTMDIYAEATEEKKQESFENLAANLDIF